MWTASARHADIVLPAATSLERNDITAVGSYSNLGYVAMHQAIKPQYESKSDYEIFRLIAREMGFEEAYTEGLDEMGWIKKFYNAARLEASQNGYEMPTFDDFWKAGWVWFPVLADSEHYNYLGDFRKNPIVNPLGTASGKIEIFSEKVASYGYDDCPGHPTWMEPTEWLGGKLAEDYPFALLRAAIVSIRSWTARKATTTPTSKTANPAGSIRPQPRSWASRRVTSCASKAVAARCSRACSSPNACVPTRSSCVTVPGTTRKSRAKKGRSTFTAATTC